MKILTPTSRSTSKGYQHLDGEKAGQYVRFRHDELGDIGRVERQQKFMKALAGQFFTFTNMLKLPMIINTGLDYVDTDMNPDDHDPCRQLLPHLWRKLHQK